MADGDGILTFPLLDFGPASGVLITVDASPDLGSAVSFTVTAQQTDGRGSFMMRGVRQLAITDDGNLQMTTEPPRG